MVNLFKIGESYINVDNINHINYHDNYPSGPIYCVEGIYLSSQKLKELLEFVESSNTNTSFFKLLASYINVNNIMTIKYHADNECSKNNFCGNRYCIKYRSDESSGVYITEKQLQELLEFIESSDLPSYMVVAPLNRQ